MLINGRTQTTATRQIRQENLCTLMDTFACFPIRFHTSMSMSICPIQGRRGVRNVSKDLLKLHRQPDWFKIHLLVLNALHFKMRLKFYGTKQRQCQCFERQSCMALKISVLRKRICNNRIERLHAACSNLQSDLPPEKRLVQHPMCERLVTQCLQSVPN